MTTPKQTAKKGARAKAGYVDFECTSSARLDEMHRYKKHAACLNGYEQMTKPTACVLLPFPTAKAARAFAKVANMSYEERLKLIESLFLECNYLAFKRHSLGLQITDTVEQTRDYALRVLSALHLPAPATTRTGET